MIDRGKTDIWFYMFIVDLIAPVTMIGFGSLFIKKRLSRSMQSFDTPQSMKNKETGNLHIDIAEPYGVLPAESAPKKNFDEYGRRRS